MDCSNTAAGSWPVSAIRASRLRARRWATGVMGERTARRCSRNSAQRSGGMFGGSGGSSMGAALPVRLTPARGRGDAGGSAALVWSASGGSGSPLATPSGGRQDHGSPCLSWSWPPACPPVGGLGGDKLLILSIGGCLLLRAVSARPAGPFWPSPWVVSARSTGRFGPRPGLFRPASRAVLARPSGFLGLASGLFRPASSTLSLRMQGAATASGRRQVAGWALIRIHWPK